MATAVHVGNRLEDELTAALSKAVAEERFEPPQLPHVAMEVLKVAQNSEASLRQIGVVLAKDQLLAARVLKAANSAIYPGPPVRHLTGAMMRIGLSGLKQLVYMYAFQGKVARRHEYQHILERYWLESVAAALAADGIARARLKDIQLPFLGALVHDIGRPIAITILADLRKQNENFRKADEATILKLVELVHARLGGLVAARWGLPKELRDAISYHHDALIFNGGGRDLVLTIGGADALIARLGLAGQPEQPFSGDALKIFRELGVDGTHLEGIIRPVRERAEQLASMMS